jgi:GNAT superfamily N-acetyltransferase
VRSARPEDALEVAGAHARSWRVGYRGLIPDEVLNGLQREDRADRYNFDEAHPDLPLTLIAINDGAICGSVAFGPSHLADASNAGEILALYVEPAAWGLGVGRRLMAEARAHLDIRGFTEAILWVLVGNDRALRFYGLDGWAPDGQQRSEEVWGVWVDEILYRRHLP